MRLGTAASDTEAGTMAQTNSIASRKTFTFNEEDIPESSEDEKLNSNIDQEIYESNKRVDSKNISHHLM